MRKSKHHLSKTMTSNKLELAKDDIPYSRFYVRCSICKRPLIQYVPVEKGKKKARCRGDMISRCKSPLGLIEIHSDHLFKDLPDSNPVLYRVNGKMIRESKLLKDMKDDPYSCIIMFMSYWSKKLTPDDHEASYILKTLNHVKSTRFFTETQILLRQFHLKRLEPTSNQVNKSKYQSETKLSPQPEAQVEMKGEAIVIDMVQDENKEAKEAEIEHSDHLHRNNLLAIKLSSDAFKDLMKQKEILDRKLAHIGNIIKIANFKINELKKQILEFHQVCKETILKTTEAWIVKSMEQNLQGLDHNSNFKFEKSTFIKSTNNLAAKMKEELVSKISWEDYSKEIQKQLDIIHTNVATLLSL